MSCHVVAHALFVVIIMVVVVTLLIVKLHDYIDEFFKFASVQHTVSINVRFCEHLHQFPHFIVAIDTIFRSNITSFYIYGSSVAESECSRRRCNFACCDIHTIVTLIMVIVVIIVIIRTHEHVSLAYCLVVTVCLVSYRVVAACESLVAHRIVLVVVVCVANIFRVPVHFMSCHVVAHLFMVIVVFIIFTGCHEFMCMSSRRSPSYVMRILWNHNRVHSNITHIPRFICAVPKIQCPIPVVRTGGIILWGIISVKSCYHCSICWVDCVVDFHSHIISKCLG